MLLAIRRLAMIDSEEVLATFRRDTVIAKSTLTVQIDTEKQQELDALAQTLACSRDDLVSQAIEQYLDLQRWQREKIQEGLRGNDEFTGIGHTTRTA